MPWTSKYAAQFTKPLVRQLLAILQRDQRAALDWVGGANVLPSIVDYEIAEIELKQFPSVLLVCRSLAFDEETDSTRHYTAAIHCAIGISHQQAAKTAELVEDYVRALDAVFETLPLSDFNAALALTLPHLGTITTTPLAATSRVMDLRVVGHDYSALLSRPEGFVKAGILTLVAEMEEA